MLRRLGYTGAVKTAMLVSGLLALGVNGCTSTDAVSRGLYDALQAREEIVGRSPGYDSSSRRPTYDEYERARRQLLDAGPGQAMRR